MCDIFSSFPCELLGHWNNELRNFISQHYMAFKYISCYGYLRKCLTSVVIKDKKNMHTHALHTPQKHTRTHTHTHSPTHTHTLTHTLTHTDTDTHTHTHRPRSNTCKRKHVRDVFVQTETQKRADSLCLLSSGTGYVPQSFRSPLIEPWERDASPPQLQPRESGYRDGCCSHPSNGE